MKTLDIIMYRDSKKYLAEYYVPARVQSVAIHCEAKPRNWILWDYSYTVSTDKTAKHPIVINLRVTFLENKVEIPKEKLLSKILRQRRVSKARPELDIKIPKKAKKIAIEAGVYKQQEY